jgi:diguanylate cyclase (GGDEF)-like protein
MIAVEPLLGIIASLTLLLVAMTTVVLAARAGRGPLYGRLPRSDRAEKHARPHRKASGEASNHTGDQSGNPRAKAHPAVRLLARGRRRSTRPEDLANLGRRATDDELEEVLRGNFALFIYNRAVRVIAWSFIPIAVLVVSISQLWQSFQPQVYITIILAGVFVLGVHEFMPPSRIGAARVVSEGSAAIVFVATLVMLTGNSTSPFFYLFPVLIGGAALIAAPGVTLILTLEAIVAYLATAFSTPMDETTFRDTVLRVTINLTALVLLAYAGTVVARVQRRTRDAAIRLSTFDSLTDLRSRAYFFNSIEHEISRSERFQHGFCLLMMDLDGLKSINDGYGHYQGDLVLQEVARLIRAGLRGMDVAARYGGDEFVAILPETDPSGAYVAAEKIRQMVSELLVQSNGHQITTSISIGVVSYPDDGSTADELMIAADEAMYASKRLGKNRVVGYAAPNEPLQAAPPQRRRTVTTTPAFRPLTEGGSGWPPEPGGRR